MDEKKYYFLLSRKHLISPAENALQKDRIDLLCNVLLNEEGSVANRYDA